MQARFRTICHCCHTAFCSHRAGRSQACTGTALNFQHRNPPHDTDHAAEQEVCHSSLLHRNMSYVWGMDKKEKAIKQFYPIKWFWWRHDCVNACLCEFFCVNIIMNHNTFLSWTTVKSCVSVLPFVNNWILGLHTHVHSEAVHGSMPLCSDTSALAPPPGNIQDCRRISPERLVSLLDWKSASWVQYLAAGGNLTQKKNMIL